MDETPASMTPLAAPQSRPGASGWERELKFTAGSRAFLDASRLPQFAGSSYGAPARRLVSVYFDTEAGDLRRHKVALRMRKDRRAWIMAVKWRPEESASAFARGEIEVAAPSGQPDIALLGEAVAADIARMTKGRPLRPAFTTEIRRSERLLHRGNATIEAAFDSGFILCGEIREPVREIELELKSGDPAELYALGLDLAASIEVQLGVESKSERGFRLAAGEPVPPARAERPRFPDEATADDAIAIVLHGCVSQFLANWPAFERGDAVEAVHQMRVAMRRLRAALAFFNRAFPCAEFLRLREEAKRIATAMGEARNWDVLEEQIRSGPLQALGSDEGLADLVGHVRERAEDGRAAVRALLAARATTAFVLDAERLAASRGWRAEGDAAARDGLGDPVRVFAAECLQRLDRRVRKRGRHFESLQPEERHRLRIALKNVRYASDFFGSLFSPGSKVRDYGRAASHLQDQLGFANDTETAAQLMAGPDIAGDLRLARAAGLVQGWLACKAGIEEHGLKAAWKDFRAAKRYWRHDLPDR